jgi:hypothetical protein
MNELMTVGETRGAHIGKLAVHSLKSCPLCNAINALGNSECFSCAWAGNFEHDPEVLRWGVLDLIDRCPELKLALSVPLVSPKRRSFRAWLRSLFRRPLLDLRV